MGIGRQVSQDSGDHMRFVVFPPIAHRQDLSHGIFRSEILERCILGQHNGILHFTIGQRRGIGIAASHPLYVLEIQSDENKIVVGSSDHLYKKKVLLTDVNLIMKDEIDAPTPVKAKIRHKHREAKAVLVSLGKNHVCLDFLNPQRAVTPGQSAVFYDGEVVVGGGIIADRIDRK